MIDLAVVNFNTSDKLMRLIETAFQDTDDTNRAFCLFVADNGSEDDSLLQLQRAQEHYDFAFYSFENIGYAKACNHLATLGTSEIVALLNADVWFTNEDIQNIQKIFDEDETISILGPKQRDETGHIVHAGMFGTNENPKHRGWREPDLDDVLYRDQADAITISGSAYFVRRSVWQDLMTCSIYQQIAPGAEGAFLPTPHYYEETWCSYHARAHGYRVVYDGTVSIGHSWHASHGVGSRADRDYFHYSQEMFRAACMIHDIACD